VFIGMLTSTTPKPFLTAQSMYGRTPSILKKVSKVTVTVIFINEPTIQALCASTVCSMGSGSARSSGLASLVQALILLGVQTYGSCMMSKIFLATCNPWVTST
jgi:hypothetical protein